jgi:hypothetical protein
MYKIEGKEKKDHISLCDDIARMKYHTQPYNSVPQCV